GTSDYTLPPTACVTVGDDGVTLAVDLAKADLLLEPEVQRFAEPLTSDGALTHRRFLLTPASLQRAAEQGVSLRYLEEWFGQRAAMPLSPAARLLYQAASLPSPRAEELLVLDTSSEEVADGLWQWPATRLFLQRRLGPTALVV